MLISNNAFKSIKYQLGYLIFTEFAKGKIFIMVGGKMEYELIKKIKTIQDKYVEQANKDMEGMTVPEQKNT